MGQAQLNRAAFLLTIRTGEGTAGNDGYRMLFGGGKFDSFADHPRQVVTALSNGKPISSSAAGAYQFLRRTWDTLAARLGLTDFSPASQDAAALELIREAGALGDVDAGRFALAVRKVRKIWASMPGAGYGQPEVALERLQAAYQAAGGVVNG
ncbi:muramidase [Cupriavidus necator H16]|nr:muramidase [Cupriavidus necator H16]QQB81157.1 glycoside hydrolase family 104 protein [Cupriavidus necator]